MLILLLLLACADPACPPAEAPLVIRQLGLSSASIGESALVIGTDGTTLLIDVGNDAHAGQVRDALGEAAVDWVLLTHYHADHIGAFDKLFPAIEVRRGVIWRGPVDVGDDANRDELAQVCAADVPFLTLCEGAATCDAPGPATACPGLAAGDLEDPHDSGPAFVRLGDARLELYAVNGFFGDERVDPGDDENARSMVGAVRLGDFSYVFGGDLTGGGKDTPDLESRVAPLLPTADVLALNHHGIRSSSNAAWLDALLPGGTRNAVVGATGAYLAAPHSDVLDAVGPRLGDGAVWVTNPGRLAGRHPKRRVVGTVEIGASERSYGICGEEFAALP